MTKIFADQEKYLNYIYSFINNYLIETLEHILLAILVYCLVCLSVYYFMHKRRLGLFFINSINLPKCKRALIITAHPDDECMFFGPTILSLTKQKNCMVYLLCLSNGMYYS